MRKIEADFWRGAVGFHLNALDLEGVSVDQFLITLGDVGIIFQFQSLTPGSDGFSRHPLPVVQLAQPEQRTGAICRGDGSLQRIPGGLPGAFTGALPNRIIDVGLRLLLGLCLPGLAQRQPHRRLPSAGGNGGLISGYRLRPVFLPGQLLGLLQQYGRCLAGGLATIADELLILSCGDSQRSIVDGVSAEG